MNISPIPCNSNGQAYGLCILKWIIILPFPLQVEESVLSIGKFNSMVSLAAFFPFKSAQAALENINAISEGEFLSSGTSNPAHPRSVKYI